jgi:hypothetical protein
MAREKRVPLMLTFLLFSGAALAASAQSTPQWTKNTVVVDGNTAQNALVSVSTDGHVLVFNTTDSRIVNLTAGQVLFLQDMGARRVVGVLKQGPLTAIATNAAALTDLIDNGTIQFPTHSSNPSILDQQDTNVGPGMDHLTGEIDDWQYTVKGDSNNNDLDFSFDAEKHLNGLDASVKGDGHLTNAGFSFAADIHSAKLQSLLFTAPLNGSLKVDWAARTTGSNSGIGEKRLKMPAFFKEIFVADHLPFLYEISANLVFIPGLGGQKDAVAGGFEVAYSGKGGFSATPKGEAPIKEMQASPQSVEKITTSALAPHGIVVAVNAPKVAFSFGTASFMEAVHSSDPNVLKNSQMADRFEGRLANFLSKNSPDFFKTEGGAYVQWVHEYDYTGSGPLSVVPNCTTTHFNLTGSGGVDAALLGLAGKGTFDLYSSSSTTTNPDIPACRVTQK